ncbi:MAG: hypothetical protein ACI4RP_09725 [Acutalibacteraceae bacterium]
MTSEEYQKIQKDLSHLLEPEVLRWKYYNADEMNVYKNAVLACKSVLSKYNPYKKG